MPSYDLSSTTTNALQEKYTRFLRSQKCAGSGLTTALEVNQERREHMIRTIKTYFLHISSPPPAVEAWTNLLQYLVKCRIALYTDHPFKWSSTFGNALRAVHIDLINFLQKAYDADNDNDVLKKIHDDQSLSPNALAALSDCSGQVSVDDRSHREAKRIFIAALGYDQALEIVPNNQTPTSYFFRPKSSYTVYPGALTAESEQVNHFVEQLSKDSFVEQLSRDNSAERLSGDHGLAHDILFYASPEKKMRENPISAKKL